MNCRLYYLKHILQRQAKVRTYYYRVSSSSHLTVQFYSHETIRPVDKGSLPNANTKCMICPYLPSRCLNDLRRRKLRLKHTVPEPTCHSEPVLVVGKVMLEVVLLEFAIVRRQAVMKISIKNRRTQSKKPELTSYGEESSASCHNMCTRICPRSTQPWLHSDHTKTHS